MPSPAPPFTDPAELVDSLRRRGYAVLAPSAVAALAGVSLEALDALAPAWHDLPPDNYLKDGGHYRHRRHACFVDDGAALTLAPHRAHWQPVEYNALHGGMRRLFAPIAEATLAAPAFAGLVRALGAVCAAVRPARPWFVEAHQFRIDTAGGIGRPTPEGAHRDGVDFVAVLLVARHAIKGGETRLFEAAGTDGKRFTMVAPWTLLLLDDAAVIHESTPILPEGEGGYRDTLVLTWRAGAFQGDDL